MQQLFWCQHSLYNQCNKLLIRYARQTLPDTCERKVRDMTHVCPRSSTFMIPGAIHLLPKPETKYVARDITDFAYLTFVVAFTVVVCCSQALYRTEKPNLELCKFALLVSCLHF